MQKSKRAKRMERHQQRHRRGGMLNLVSLMDIFTILVFFLLVSSSEVEVLQNPKSIEIPESIAETRPRETLVVMVTAKDILVQGKPVAAVADALENAGPTVPALSVALEAHRADDASGGEDREITIMGDKSLPYRLLRKVMATCTQADYGHISLAVTQKSATLARSAR
ncbi:hypothetical protein BH24PSE2_BH24PSE2_17690 [soil metagenome]